MKYSASSKKKNKRRKRKSNAPKRFATWFWAVVVPLILGSFIEVQTGFIGNMISNWIDKVEYKEAIITPLYYGYNTDSIDLSSARNYLEKYGSETLDCGCVLSTYVQNNKSKDVSVSEASVVIDKIQKTEEPAIFVIGEYQRGEKSFSLYAINNGSGVLDYGEVSIWGNYFDVEEKDYAELDEKQLSDLFIGYEIAKVEDLQAGEIRRIAKYTVNEEAFIKSPQYGLGYHVVNADGDNLQEKHSNIGMFTYETGDILFYYSQGGSEEFTVERSLPIKVDEYEGKKLNIPANFMIEGNSWKNILYALYPDSSCELEFHAEIKCAGQKDVIKTEVFRQKIYVPLYKEEEWFFVSIREFIKEYNIETYYYNSNIPAQKAIDYELPQ